MVDIQFLWEGKSEANDEVQKICFNDCSPSCHLYPCNLHNSDKF